jgi:hypothetical protein
MTTNGSAEAITSFFGQEKIPATFVRPSVEIEISTLDSSFNYLNAITKF